MSVHVDEVQTRVVPTPTPREERQDGERPAAARGGRGRVGEHVPAGAPRRMPYGGTRLR